MLPLFVSSPRQHVPLLAIGTLLASSLVLRCASMDDSGGRFSQTDAAVTGEGGRSQISTNTGGWQFFVDTGGSGVTPVITGMYRCEPATVEKNCPLPAPMCDGATTLAFLTDAKCVNFNCQWTRRTRACAHVCTSGACDPAGDASNRDRDAGTQCTALASNADATSGDARADAARGCDIPRSVCIDARYLLYFADSHCEFGTCRSVAMVRECAAGCVDGACEYNLTR